MFLLTERDGEIEYDHRASPGYDALRPEGSVVRFATSGCPHCHTVQVLNPNRTRERPYCRTCNAYICDGCDVHRRHPDYEHFTFLEMVEKCSAGTHVRIDTVDGPRLIPKWRFEALTPP
jgi:hypothetical protein